MIYLLDTNTVSGLIVFLPSVSQRTEASLARGDVLGFCRPVYFELLRGLLVKKANRKLATLRGILLPQFETIPLLDEDWEQAAQFWANAVSTGKQVNDIDLLIAGIAYRLNATIVSSDQDFDALPVKREDWRVPQS